MGEPWRSNGDFVTPPRSFTARLRCWLAAIRSGLLPVFAYFHLLEQIDGGAHCQRCGFGQRGRWLPCPGSCTTAEECVQRLVHEVGSDECPVQVKKGCRFTTELPPSATTGKVCLVAHPNVEAATAVFATGNRANVPGGSASRGQRAAPAW